MLESTARFTLDYAGIDDLVEDATSGECLIQVPEVRVTGSIPVPEDRDSGLHAMESSLAVRA